MKDSYERYNKKCRFFSVRLNLEKDKDIIEYLDSVNVCQLVREAVREAIKNNSCEQ